MIKFRQKEFVLPLAAIGGSLLTNGVVSAGVGAVGQLGAAKTAAKQQEESDRTQERIARQQNIQAVKDRQAQQKQAQDQLAFQKQQLKAANNQYNKQLKLARKTGVSVTPNITVTQPQQQQFSKTTEAAGFVKNLGTLAKGRGLNKVLAGAAVTGAISGTGAYLVDKAIQRDANKSGILKVERPELTKEEKAAKKKKRNRKLITAAGTTAALVGSGIAAKKGLFGSDVKNIASKVTLESIKKKARDGVSTAIEATKDHYAPINKETGKRKLDKLNLVVSGIGTATPAAMYVLKKKQLKDQIKQSEQPNTEEEEKTYSKIDFGKIKSGIKNATSAGEAHFRNKNKNSYQGNAADAIQRSRINRLYAPKGRTERYKVKDWLHNLKKNPGDTLLDTLSFRTGGGGKKGVSGFGNDLIRIGKETGNETSQKVGKFIVDHPKTAMVGSAGLGFGVIRTAKRKLSGLGSKALEKVDPNAYAYSKYGAQPILQDNKEEETKDE